LHAAYQTADHEVALKTLDYSSSSITDRWSAGAADLARGLDLVEPNLVQRGLTVRAII
jgi:hypothetical protein